jgi:LysM repeat protein
MLKTCLRIVTAALLTAALAGVSPAGVYAYDDTDGDGIVNPLDNCPTTFNPDQADSNHDGIGDACAGTDGDGVPDIIDNCPTVYNPDQKNTYGGPAGDACEAESGVRLNGSANNIIVYEMVNVAQVQFYTAGGQQLGGVTNADLQALAARGPGAVLNVTTDGKVTVTYLGGTVFSVTDALVSPSLVSTFSFAGITPGSSASSQSAPAAPAPVTYTVRAGDTLSKIAAKFKTSVTALVKANHLKDANFLRIGQTLTIP